MNKNKLYRRILATVLSVVMVLGLLPISAAAAGTTFSADISKGSVNVSSGQITYYGSDGGEQTATYSSDDSIVITGNTTENTVTVDGSTDVDITLNNANIQLTEENKCAFELKNGASVNLTLAENTTNTFKSGKDCAGLQVPSGTAITINGGGTLKATGDGGGAGIGGGKYIAGGTFTINSGIITARGGMGAGIGGGVQAEGGTLTITGGTIDAPGIGCGVNGNYKNDYCYISGGSVYEKEASYILSQTQVSASDTTPVYMTTVTLNGISAKTAVDSLTATYNSASYSYGTSDMNTDASGKLYLWLPAGAMVTGASVGQTSYSGSVTTTADSKAEGTLTVAEDSAAPVLESLTVTYKDGTTATATDGKLTCAKGKVVQSIVVQMDESVTVADNTIVTMQATGTDDECAQEMGTGSHDYGTIAVDAADSSKLIITPDGLNANAAYLGEMTFTVAAGAITDLSNNSNADAITFKLTVTEDSAAPILKSLTVTYTDGTTATADNNNALTCTKGKVVQSIVAQMDESVTVADNTIVTMQATGAADECAQEMGTESHDYGTIAVDAADSSKLIITPDGLNAKAAYLGDMTFTVAAGAIKDKNDPSAANTKITFKLTVTEDTAAPILKSLTVTYTDGTAATADEHNALTCTKGKVVQSIVAQMDESVTVADNTIVTMQATGTDDECAQEMGTGSHDYGTIAVDATDSSKLIITPDGLNANAAYLGEMTFTVAAGAITDLSNNSNADAITFKLTVKAETDVFDYANEPESGTFYLRVKTESDNEEFQIPVSGCADSSTYDVTYDWSVDWGDGNKENKSGKSSKDGGIPHTYGEAGTYTITITPNGTASAGWFRAFTSSRYVTGSGKSDNRNMITGFAGVLDDSVENLESPGNYYATDMFFGCENLTAANIRFDISVETVGTKFAADMFNGCISLQTLPDDFNLPSSIRSVGKYFAYQMFRSCSALPALPENFNLPRNIDSVNWSFAHGMFRECEALESLPEDFSLPAGIQSISDNFATSMFYECKSLKINSKFSFPALKQEQIDGYEVLYETFIGIEAEQNPGQASAILSNLPDDADDVAYTKIHPSEDRDTFSECFNNDLSWNKIQANWKVTDSKYIYSSVLPSGKDVALKGDVVITFIKEMATTGTVKLFDGTNETELNSGNWSEDKTVYTIPYSGLAAGAEYTILISGFKDKDGKEAPADSNHQFTVKTKATVTYNWNYEAADPYTTKIIAANDKAVIPDTPERAGYTFDGWYKDKSCTNAWNFGTDTVVDTTELYAKWTAKTASTLEVTYASGGATSGSVPKDEADYSSSATVTVKGNTGMLSKSGYAFAGWRDGMKTYTAGQTFEISKNTVLTAVWTENTAEYTVTYSNNYSGGGNDTTQTVTHGALLTKPATPARDGYTFIGWYKDAACKKAWSFDMDTVTGDTTLYAKWAQGTYSVSGTVEDDTEPTSIKVQGATVKVMQGNIQFGDTVLTDVDGKFTVTGIPNGEYNFVIAKDGRTVTLHIRVDGSDFTYEGQIILPSGNKNSKLDIIGAETPNIVEKGLQDLFEDTDIYDDIGKNAVNNNGTVEIRLTVQKDDSSPEKGTVTAQMSSAGYEAGIVLDVGIEKTVMTSNGEVSDQREIPELKNALTLIIPLPAELQGKSNYVVYRMHNGSVYKITTTETNGEYIEISVDKTYLILHAKYFSTYAIGYSESNGGAPIGGGSLPIGGGSSPTAQSYTITATAGEGGSINPSGNVSVVKGTNKTFTFTPADGYVIADVLVDGKSVGAVSSYTFSAVDAGHTISAAFVKAEGLPYYLDGDGNKVFIGFSTSASGTMKYIAPDGETVLLTPNPKNFTDIAGHWAKDYIDFVTQREIFVGTGADTFSPDTGMTRAMFATVIGRLYERSYGALTTSETHALTDCDYSEWYGSYIGWCSENGIIEGVGGGLFEPGREITRQEMAAVLYRFAQFLEVSGASSDTALNYPDAAEIDSWAREAASYCQETGIIGGRDNDRFAPQETATRAEVATILERFVETVV